ncbi:hypothetical protein GALMADRAFT_1335817 [Galerina marginata CBS 339.88]|uniref:Uncharacterized protein n=1 Tax=Galerina marginata (strain CBS 339.88) TaxID=685588 RepID=A0A067SSP7_GALM3|nr:hypothetical protein GALMADRAFT_1335817 [Galerina marginata CBS 339.88]
MYTNLKAYLAIVVFSLCAIGALALDFSNSKWVWSNNVDGSGLVPPSSSALRRTWCPPAGKTPTTANIMMTADDAYIFYVNGIQIGTGNSWQVVNIFCGHVNLASAGCTVFAINATNSPSSSSSTDHNPAGVLAAMQIFYVDGTSDFLFTDNSWLGITPVPAGFQQEGFNDKSWAPVVPVASYGGGQWGAIGNIFFPPPTCPSLAFTDASWIWANELNQGSAPVGTRAFRKTFTLPPGQTTSHVTVVMDADNGYVLAVQGLRLGSSDNWAVGGLTYSIDLGAPVSAVLVSVVATNTVVGPAGLIAAVLLTTGSGAVIPFFTDNTWKYFLGNPVGSQLVGFDDSQWPTAIIEGPYGTAPWGNLPIPGT